MDVFARRTNKRGMLRGMAALTSYPARSRKLIPGLAGASKLPPTKFIPLNTNDFYSYTKSLASPKSIEQNDTFKVSSADPNVQIGFGLVNEDSDEDISYTSPQKVDPSVLNAFVNPSFKTNSTKLIPQATSVKRKKEKVEKDLNTLTNPQAPKKQRMGLKLKFSK
jgi:hypothetical protein